jgi:hypothetical protein
VRDFGAAHRLAPGFVTDGHLDGDVRIVTFANGILTRELLVDCDDSRWRLVYAITSERVKHYNASAQVLPIEVAAYIAVQMEQGALAMH